MAQTIAGRVDLLDAAGEGKTLAFRATNAAGNTLVLESPALPAVEGGHGGVSPMEVVLLGLGGCTSIDVISTLRKMRQRVEGYEVRVQGERRDTHPRIYTQIRVEHVLRGTALREAAVRRAIALSAARYCSVSAMLEQSAQVEIAYRIVERETGAERTGTVTHADAPPAGEETAG